MSLSYRNQSIDLLCKSVNWFQCDRNLHHERVNLKVFLRRLKLSKNYDILIKNIMGENKLSRLVPTEILFKGIFKFENVKWPSLV